MLSDLAATVSVTLLRERLFPLESLVVEGSNEDIRYWLDEVQLYVMLHRPLHSTILKKDNQIIFKAICEDTFAPKSHPGE